MKAPEIPGLITVCGKGLRKALTLMWKKLNSVGRRLVKSKYLLKYHET